jgi:hypothetical protein
MKVDLGPVIAERRLRVTGQPGLDVRVRIGTPRPFLTIPTQTTTPPTKSRVWEVPRSGMRVESTQCRPLSPRFTFSRQNSIALRQKYPGVGWEDAPEGEYGFSRAVSTFAQNGAPKHDDE